jgi:hypothetical protein
MHAVHPVDCLPRICQPLKGDVRCSAGRPVLVSMPCKRWIRASGARDIAGLEMGSHNNAGHNSQEIERSHVTGSGYKNADAQLRRAEAWMRVRRPTERLSCERLPGRPIRSDLLSRRGVCREDDKARVVISPSREMIDVEELDVERARGVQTAQAGGSPA